MLEAALSYFRKVILQEVSLLPTHRVPAHVHLTRLVLVAAAVLVFAALSGCMRMVKEPTNESALTVCIGWCDSYTRVSDNHSGESEAGTDPVPEPEPEREQAIPTKLLRDELRDDYRPTKEDW